MKAGDTIYIMGRYLRKGTIIKQLPKKMPDDEPVYECAMQAYYIGKHEAEPAYTAHYTQSRLHTNFKDKC